jgi:hypothetical protein
LTVKKRTKDVNMNIELHGLWLSKGKKSTNQFVDYKAPRQGHKQRPTLESDKRSIPVLLLLTIITMLGLR